MEDFLNLWGAWGKVTKLKKGIFLISVTMCMIFYEVFTIDKTFSMDGIIIEIKFLTEARVCMGCTNKSRKCLHKVITENNYCLIGAKKM